MAELFHIYSPVMHRRKALLNKFSFPVYGFQHPVDILSSSSIIKHFHPEYC